MAEIDLSLFHVCARLLEILGEPMEVCGRSSEQKKPITCGRKGSGCGSADATGGSSDQDDAQNAMEC
jgi:hypothetical protein